MDAALGKIKAILYEFLFPDKCMICSELTGGGYLCAGCKDKLEAIENPCPLCASPMTGDFCKECEHSGFLFEHSIAYTLYSDQTKNIIHQMKYSDKPEIAWKMAELMNNELDLSVLSGYDAIVAVPLNKKRERERGYNQAAIFAERIGILLEIKNLPKALRRIKNTEAQFTLNEAERRENVKDAFAARPELVRGKSIVIADDIFTTGSTLNECAKTLLDAGAKRIACISFTRTKYNSRNSENNIKNC